MTPNNKLPFYTNKTFNKYNSNVNGNFMWLFGSRR